GPRSSIFALFERRQHDETLPVTATLPEGGFNTHIPTPSRNLFLNLRADFLLSDRQTVSLSFNHNGGRQRGSELTSFDLPERSSDTRLSEQVLQASWRVIVSPSLINEVLLRVGREGSRNSTNNPAPAVEVAGAFNRGGPQCCPESQTGERLSAADNLTFSSG